MSTAERLKNIVNEALKDEGVFLVEHRFKPNGSKHIFFIDSELDLPMQTISSVSRKVSEAIDEEEWEDQKLIIEVSSPGADSPILDIRQYPKHLGRTFNMKLNNSQNFVGKLIAINKDELDLDCTEKGKNKETIINTIKFEEIMKSTIKLNFKK